MAIKLVRHHHVLSGHPRRNLVVALRGSFHGLTFGGFALTGEDLGQRVYGVDQRLVRHVSPSDIGELTTLLRRNGDQVAAVVVEPVLGSGTVPWPRNTSPSSSGCATRPASCWSPTRSPPASDGRACSSPPRPGPGSPTC